MPPPPKAGVRPAGQLLGGGFLDGLVDVLRAHVEFLGHVLLGFQCRLADSLLQPALADNPRVLTPSQGCGGERQPLHQDHDSKPADGSSRSNARMRLKSWPARHPVGVTIGRPRSCCLWSSGSAAISHGPADLVWRRPGMTRHGTRSCRPGSASGVPPRRCRIAESVAMRLSRA